MYAHGVVLPSEDLNNLPVFLDRPSPRVDMFGLSFAHGKCKMSFQGLNAAKLIRFLTREQLAKVDRFGYLGRCISPGGRLSGAVFARTQKVRLVLANVKHLVIDHRSSIHGSSECGIILLFRSMAAERRTCDFRCLNPVVSVLLVDYSGRIS